MEMASLRRRSNHRSRAAWACLRTFLRRADSTVEAQGPSPEAAAMEVPLHGCMGWAPCRDRYHMLRKTHHRLLQRVEGTAARVARSGSYRTRRLTIRSGQALGVTTRLWPLLLEGASPGNRMDDSPRFGNLLGEKDPGTGRLEQNWLKCKYLRADFQALRKQTNIRKKSTNVWCSWHHEDCRSERAVGGAVVRGDAAGSGDAHDHLAQG